MFLTCFFDGVKLPGLLVDAVVGEDLFWRLFWAEFCTDGFFLSLDGVDFLYRPCDFMHAGLCVLCLGFGVCWVLTFAAALLFSQLCGDLTCRLLLGLSSLPGEQSARHANKSATFDRLWPLSCRVCLRGFKSFLPSGECRTLYNQILLIIIVILS